MLCEFVTFELRRWDVVIFRWVSGEVMVGDVNCFIETILVMVDFEGEHSRFVIIFRNPILMLLGGYLIIH